MDSPIFGRKCGKLWNLWGDLHSSSTKTTSSSSLSAYHDKKNSKQEFDLQYLATSNLKGSEPRSCVKPRTVHPRAERGYDLAMDETHFPRLGGNGRGGHQLISRAMNHSENEGESVSVDYEPTPKKGHYRIVNRDNNAGSQGPSTAACRRDDNYVCERRYGSHKKQNSASLTSFDYRLTSPSVEDHRQKTLFGYQQCNVHTGIKKVHLDSDVNRISRQMSLRSGRFPSPTPRLTEGADFLTPMLLGSSYSDRTTKTQVAAAKNIRTRSAERESKLQGIVSSGNAKQVHAEQVGEVPAFSEQCHAGRPYTGQVTRFHVSARQCHANDIHGRHEQIEEASKFYLSARQIHTRTHIASVESFQASSQHLLSILAENLALSMSDMDFINIVLKQKKPRMSYTKSLADITTNAMGDLKFRPLTPDLDAQTSPPRAEFKRFRSIYMNS